MSYDRKIYDVLPPDSVSLKTEEAPVLRRKENSKRAGLKKKIAAFLAVIILPVLAYFFINLSRAEIIIWPQMENVNAVQDLKIDAGLDKIDLQAFALPGNAVEEEKNEVFQFSATGEKTKESRAEGTIRVYNNYSTAPQTFVVNTRFMSDSGKVFRALTKVVVPGKKLEEGKWVQGWVDVKVAALEAGPDYNIGPSTFSLPGLSGSALYTYFYGKSSSPMDGGFIGKTPFVLQADIDSAKENAIQSLKKAGGESLRSSLGNEFVFLDEAFLQEVIDSFSSAKAGQEIKSFEVSVKIVSRALIFKRSDAEAIAREILGSNLESNRKIYENSFSVEWSPKEIDLKKGEMALRIDAIAKSYPDIDIPGLKNDLSRKPLADALLYLEDRPEVLKAQVKLWPFWVKKVPKNIERIKVDFRFDTNSI